jgi:hypothetical protein
MTTAIQPVRVALRPTTLSEIWAFALNGDEFQQIPGRLSDARNGRCVWGVLREMCQRAGLSDDETIAAMREVQTLDHAAARLLGFDCIEWANDAGVPFVQIAAAMREAARCDERVTLSSSTP